MITEEILILKREDLAPKFNDKEFELITMFDKKDTIKDTEVYGVILFIDKNGKTKILKNRHGSTR